MCNSSCRVFAAGIQFRATKLTFGTSYVFIYEYFFSKCTVHIHLPHAHGSIRRILSISKIHNRELSFLAFTHIETLSNILSEVVLILVNINNNCYTSISMGVCTNMVFTEVENFK